MRRRFDKKKYGQRRQTETANSMVKRRLGSALRARGYWSQCREIVLRVITHNVMIVARVRVFYRAGRTPLHRHVVESLTATGPFCRGSLPYPCTEPRRARQARSPRIACWPDGWQSALPAYFEEYERLLPMCPAVIPELGAG